jgi:hypothetical protein
MDKNMYEKYFKFEEYYNKIINKNFQDYNNYKNNMFNYNIDIRIEKIKKYYDYKLNNTFKQLNKYLDDNDMLEYKINKYYHDVWSGEKYLNTKFINEKLFIKNFSNLIIENTNNIYINNKELDSIFHGYHYPYNGLDLSYKFNKYKSLYITKMLELEKKYIYEKINYSYERTNYISCLTKDINDIIKKDILDVCSHKNSYRLNKECIDNIFVSHVKSKIETKNLDFPFHNIYNKCYEERNNLNI